MVKEKDPAAYWLTMGQLALSDYWFYLTEVLQYRFLDPWDHGEEMVWHLEKNLGKPQIFLVPRGGGKSSCITIPLLPWLLAKDPNLRGAICNVREQRAIAMGKESAAILANPRFRRCYPWIVPSSKWGERGFFLEQVVNEIDGIEEQELGRIDPTISMFGVGSNITGSHLRAMLHDDLISRETYTSPAECQKAESFFVESLNCCDPGGIFNVCCTRWNHNDVYGKIVSGQYRFHGLKFETFQRGAFRTVLDHNGEYVTEIYNPHRTYVDLNGNQHQVGYTPEFLESQKEAEGALFWALYMNDPTGDGNQELAVEQIRDYVNLPFDEFEPPRVGIEVNGGGGSLFYGAFINLMRERNYRFPVEQIKTPTRSQKGKSTDKHDRIRAVVQPVVEAGNLFIHEHHMRKPGGLGQELREFPRGDDDQADALHMCMNRAPKYVPNRPVKLYLAVDPAFTSNTQSDHSAIVVGGWYYDSFYVVDVHKFKLNKADAIAEQVFRMWAKWSLGRTNQGTARKPKVRQFYSSGNAPRKQVNTRYRSVWGDGLYLPPKVFNEEK